MKIIKTSLNDALLIETKVFGDHRGFFQEYYSEKVFQSNVLNFNFVQDNHSFSKEPGVLRRLHFQKGEATQTKLVRVTSGVVWDVIVDLRSESTTYGKWQGFILSEFNQRQLIVTKGFAHGFVTLTPNVNFLYKCDDYYSADAVASIAFNDRTLGIDWPIDLDKSILSDKDKAHPSFEEFELTNEF